VGVPARRVGHLRPARYLRRSGRADHRVPTADDTRRVAFIDGALEALRAALTDGVDVRGYCHWTFIDNFEWTLGYAPTFGLVAVDRRTFTRIPKPSAHHLGAIARQASTGTGVRG
jgi:beta-glucosidase